MATFDEMQKRLLVAKNTKTVVEYLVEHIDSNFKGVGGEKPKSFMLNEDKLPIPQETFESVVSDFLLKKASELHEEITHILQTDLNAPKVIPPPGHETWPVPPPAAPEQQEAAVLPFNPQPAQAPEPAQPRAPRRSRSPQ